MKIAAVTVTIAIATAMMSLTAVSSSSHQLGGLRGLKSFVEKSASNNITFDCSPSGPCVPCLYSEKKDVSYRCSETGYRIPMKCAKMIDKPNSLQQQDEDEGDSSSTTLPEQAYVTYRSCIPAVNQENLSVLAFEAFMLLLLITSSFVIFRRKGGLVMPGAIRLPTNPRF